MSYVHVYLTFFIFQKKKKALQAHQSGAGFQTLGKTVHYKHIQNDI